MRHMKRQTMPKSWPVPRKGNKYVVRPNFGNDKGLPILIMLRDILGVLRIGSRIKLCANPIRKWITSLGLF